MFLFVARRVYCKIWEWEQRDKSLHHKEPARGIWDVWVAFGHVSGTRGRAKVTSPGSAEISDNRVRIGSFLVE